MQRITQLLDDLNVIRDAHPELYWDLYQLLGWLLLPDGFVWSQPDNREEQRHAVVRHLLERGTKWDDAFRKASDELRKPSYRLGPSHPAAVGPDRMAAAYKRIERGLPPNMRRPKRRPR